MNSNTLKPKTILVNLNLCFDFYSTLFSAYRTYFAKHSIPINNLKHCIEDRSLEEGLNILINEVSQGMDTKQTREELTPLLDVSLSCIKPVISIYSIFDDLSKNGIKVKTFTNFEDYVVKFVKEAQKEWFKYDIFQVKENQEIKDFLSNYPSDQTVLIDSSIESCLNIKKELGFCTVFVPHSKHIYENLLKDEELKKTLDNNKIYTYEFFEGIDWNQLGVSNTLKLPEPSFYLKLDSKPNNKEYEVWQNISKFKEPIELTSNIVHGFGRGGKKLGIPTANLDMTPEIEEKLLDLVTGVYYGWAEFIPPFGENIKEEVDYNGKLPMVMSIGFNPYFNNKYKTAEAHIMKKFSSDFYNSSLKVIILGFIRTEADFIKFSHLIEAIHNDVQVAKDILNVDTTN